LAFAAKSKKPSASNINCFTEGLDTYPMNRIFASENRVDDDIGPVKVIYSPSKLVVY